MAKNNFLAWRAENSGGRDISEKREGKAGRKEDKNAMPIEEGVKNLGHLSWWWIHRVGQ